MERQECWLLQVTVLSGEKESTMAKTAKRSEGWTDSKGGFEDGGGWLGADAIMNNTV